MNESPASRARRAFTAHFGQQPEWIARAPGRVNLIGEHTDYNEGFVFPCAISAHTAMAARLNASSTIRLVANDFGDACDRFEITPDIARSERHPWSDYLRGVMVEALGRGWPVPGFDVTIAGNVPPGSGLSSSAALEVAFAALLAKLSGTDATPQTLARMSQRAENGFVGMQCGIMDQLASAEGMAGCALLIDCRSLDIRAIRVPDSFSILIVHSGVKHAHVGGEYNARRRQCEAAAAALGVPALRDAGLADLARIERSVDAETFARARHVITENARTLEAADALVAEDLAALGRLFAQSHRSMREDFEITVPEIDRLVDILQASIGPRGGARMTGGGFGGCVVAIFEKGREDEIITSVRRDYFHGGDGLILSGKPAAGLRISPADGTADEDATI